MHGPDTSAAECLSARVRPAEDHSQERQRWSKDKRDLFDRLAPHALCIVATDAPLSSVVFGRGGPERRYGDNRGCWPVRVALSGQWRDRVTESWNRNPFCWTGVQVRVWTPSVQEAGQLALGVAGLLGRMAEDAMGSELLNGFLDLGPDLDLPMLEMEIHALAQRLRLRVWDDDGLSCWLDGMLRRGERRAAGVRMNVIEKTQ